MPDFFFSKATGRNILVGIVLILIINFVVFPYFPRLFGISIPLSSILDLQFGFENDFVRRLLNILGEKGREVYFLSTLCVDIPYAIIYGFTYALSMAYLLKRKAMYSFRFLVLLPLLIGFFDLLENFGILYLLQNPFTYDEKRVFYISWANKMKWIFSLLTILSFLFVWIKPTKKT